MGTTSTTSNGLNQIAGWVSTLGYDAKGNITSDGTYTYGYSSENLLTSLANSASGAIQASSTYAYDPLMRLAVINSSNDSLDASLGYDGDDFVYEGLSSSRTRRYIRGPGVDEPLVAFLITSTGTSRLWYQADERGSIVRLSNDSGVGGIGKFDEYGVGGSGRIRYAGQYWLADGNLIYSRARIYDARLGRFLQPDPIEYEAGMNIYAYVLGDPVNFTDPSGLNGCGASDDEEIQICGGGGRPRMLNAASLGGGSGGRFELNMPSDGSGSGESGANYCKIGNVIMTGAEKAGEASLYLTGAGLAVFGAGAITGNPVALTGGAALAQVGNVIGIGSAVAQTVGGLAQGRGGGGYKNAAAGVVNIATGVVVSRALRATIPRGWHNGTRQAAERNNSMVGNVISMAQGLSDWLSPTQVDCPGK